jgi:hypothetical protein
VSTRDVERLLREVSRVPLGPMSITFATAGTDVWQLAVSWSGLPGAAVTVVHDAAGDSVRLEREAPYSGPPDRLAATIAGRPWVLEVLPVASGIAARLWLRLEGLQANTLLAALAEMARLELVLLPPAAHPTAQTAPAPPPQSTPARPPPQPAPIEDLVRPASWQSLSTSPTPAPAAGQQPPAATQPPPPPPAISPLPPASAPPAEPAATSSAGPAGYCRECGHPFRPDHTFCVNCGARLN